VAVGGAAIDATHGSAVLERATAEQQKAPGEDVVLQSIGSA
jgi:hypothetical protein